MAEFQDVITENDADLLEQEVHEELQARFEDWDPAAGGLATWMIKTFCRLTGTTRDLLVDAYRAKFKSFGQTLVNVPPILAAPAMVTSTWTMVDGAGYTIRDGTKVSIAAAGDEAFAFQTVGEVVIEPGDTATGAGEVVLQAVEPGEARNGLFADPKPLDSDAATSAVDSIALEGVTSGGVDEEDEDAYLVRLKESLQLLSLSLILPRDFEIDARAVAGIARALCIPNYNPDDESDDNALMLCVFPVDEDGQALSTPVKEELQERQQAKVPVDVIVKVADPTYTLIDTETKVAILSGYDKPTVVAAVKARLADYYSPAKAGLPGVGDASTSTGWEQIEMIYFNEVISEIDRVPGVSRVVSLKICKGGGELGTANVDLDGVASLTEAGEITVSAE